MPDYSQFNQAVGKFSSSPSFLMSWSFLSNVIVLIRVASERASSEARGEVSEPEEN